VEDENCGKALPGRAAPLGSVPGLHSSGVASRWAVVWGFVQCVEVTPGGTR